MSEKMKMKKDKQNFIFISVILFLVLSCALLINAVVNNSQAEWAIVPDVRLIGEYKIGDGEWQPIVEGEHISATQGDVTLRGIFQRHNPTTNEVIGPLPAGSTVSLYFNHIGGQVILPSGGKIIFDAENEKMGEDACASMWGSAPSAGDAPITIVLHNPHTFGNENAIDEFFEHMSIAPGTYLEGIMLEKGDTQRSIGLLIYFSHLFVDAFISLAISAFALILSLVL